MSKRFTCAETAKLVRAALKEAFPEITFSVRSHVYSMGASIRIGWTDGPLTSQVEPLVKCSAGASFNGMEDIKEYRDAVLNGEKVHFGADYVFTSREVSKERLEALAAQIEKLGKEMWLTVAVEAGHPSPCHAADAFTASEFAYSLLQNVPNAKFEGRTASTVAEQIAA